jgi:hypothetical protein
MKDDVILNLEKSTFISRVAQLLAYVPDKATMGAASALTSWYPCSICCLSSSPNYTWFFPA